MQTFNRAYERTFIAGRVTLGLMTPLVRAPRAMADVQLERIAAQRAERYGFAALWVRDVPLMVPQGSQMEAVALDDPFQWLATLAAATDAIALGTAAAVLPLRHPLHLAKSALSLDRLSGGRFILGAGSGDREAEFAAFGVDANDSAALFRSKWDVLRSALAPQQARRAPFLRASGGYELMELPAARVPMLVVGSARQSLQWIAANADGWASYHRDVARQQGRIGLWQAALAERAGGQAKPFVQSIRLELASRADAPLEAIELGVRAGRLALRDYLERMGGIGVAHVLVNLVSGARPVLDMIDELGLDLLPGMA
jgi:luciferase-type oxidoreductase